jgi:hypothetical protein
MTREQMASLWRFAAVGDPLLQGVTGQYFAEVFAKKGGMSPEISKSLGWERTGQFRAAINARDHTPKEATSMGCDQPKVVTCSQASIIETLVQMLGYVMADGYPAANVPEKLAEIAEALGRANPFGDPELTAMLTPAAGEPQAPDECAGKCEEAAAGSGEPAAQAEADQGA